MSGDFYSLYNHFKFGKFVEMATLIWYDRRIQVVTEDRLNIA